MDVYFVSGLGADERIFKKIKLPSSYTIHHIKWIPFGAGETLANYSKRLAAAIDVSKPFSLVGLSLGGMIVSEMCTFLHPQKAIAISTATNAKQLPPYFKLAGSIGLNKIVPTSFYKTPTAVAHWFFGIKTDEEKELFKSIIRDADPQFVRNAINAVLNWKKKEKPAAVVQLHGSSDKLLPIKFAQPNIVLKGGGHFMIITKADEISALLEKILSSKD
jgi:pimeloyl-ACP methyl ester carboxylesterase